MQTNPATGSQPANKVMPRNLNSPFTFQPGMCWLPVTIATNIVYIDPVGLPVVKLPLAASPSIRALSQILTPPLKLASVTEINQLIVVNRGFDESFVGVGFRDCR
jgi:hypothetical protein